MYVIDNPSFTAFVSTRKHERTITPNKHTHHGALVSVAERRIVKIPLILHYQLQKALNKLIDEQMWR
jgi:hypothetical protein